MTALGGEGGERRREGAEARRTQGGTQRETRGREGGEGGRGRRRGSGGGRRRRRRTTRAEGKGGTGRETRGEDGEEGETLTKNLKEGPGNFIGNIILWTIKSALVTHALHATGAEHGESCLEAPQSWR